MNDLARGNFMAKSQVKTKRASKSQSLDPKTGVKNSLAVIKKTKDSSLEYHKDKVLQTEFSKVMAMTGSSRRDFLDSVHSYERYSDKEIATLMAGQYNLQHLNLSDFEIDINVVIKIPKKLCERYNVVPVMEIENTLVVAFSDPGDLQAKDDISLCTNCKIEIVVAERDKIREVIAQYHKIEDEDKIQNIFDFVESSGEESKAVGTEKEILNKNVQLDPTVQSVDHILKEGINLGCSDIHIEIYEQKCRVRFRVDGHLDEYIHPPVQMANSMASRIKVMSRLNISEKRLPQDGRFKTTVGDKTVSFRVSTVPVVSGEKIVMRILDESALGTDIQMLGMNKNQLDTFKKYLNMSQGLILMTGPTGSGKTTTIYSGLQQLNTPARNISTGEDPVEYKLQGINQVQIDPKIGLTFANVLRSFLRQDPDVILVGEIRDKETANIAYRASATGHLVLSTLHTNDSVSTVTRLMDIGLPAYTVAENTSVVVAQRLLRVLCPNCKTSQDINSETLKLVGFKDEEIPEVKPHIVGPQGCRQCNHSGYKGRMAVFEVLDISPNLKAGIIKGLTPRELKKRAIEMDGLQTLRRSALEKLKNGLTSIDEVMYGTMGDEQ